MVLPAEVAPNRLSQGAAIDKGYGGEALEHRQRRDALLTDRLPVMLLRK